MGCPDGGQVHSAPAGGQEEVFPRIVHAAKSAQLRLLAVTSATSPFWTKPASLLRRSPPRGPPIGLSLSERDRARSKEKRVSQQLCTYAQNCRTGGVGAVPAPILPDFRARLVPSGIRQRPPRGAIPPPSGQPPSGLPSLFAVAVCSVRRTVQLRGRKPGGRLHLVTREHTWPPGRAAPKDPPGPQQCPGSGLCPRGQTG